MKTLFIAATNVTSIRAQQSLLALGLICALTACGGGGADAPTSPTPSGTSLTSTQTPSTTTTTSSACPATTLDDVWLDKRLTCLKPGTKVFTSPVIKNYATTNYSYVVNQQVLDAGFNNVMVGSMKRYFARILCVRNTPVGYTSTSNLLTLASDLGLAVRSAGPLTAGYSIWFGILGRNQVSYVEEKCDTAKHPIIIDYATGLIESVTPSAMANVQVYDLD